jgi:hypothetical protein
MVEHLCNFNRQNCSFDVKKKKRKKKTTTRNINLPSSTQDHHRDRAVILLCELLEVRSGKSKEQAESGGENETATTHAHKIETQRVNHIPEELHRQFHPNRAEQDTPVS